MVYTTRARTTGKAHLLVAGLTFVRKRRNRTEGEAGDGCNQQRYALREKVGPAGNKIERKDLGFKEGRLIKTTRGRKSQGEKASQAAKPGPGKGVLTRAGARILETGLLDVEDGVAAASGTSGPQEEIVTPENVGEFPVHYDLESLEDENRVVPVQQSARLSDRTLRTTPRRPVGKGTAKPKGLVL